MIIFGSVQFSLEKINQAEIIIFLNFKPKPVQIDWFQFRFGFCCSKTGKT
jgi:hypothetical protein